MRYRGEKAPTDQSAIDADALLCEQVAAGDKRAGREFYDKYHRLAGYMASQIIDRSPTNGVVSHDDLSQEALVYMLEQIPRFQQDREIPFASFASVYMRHTLERVLAKQHGAKLPHDKITIVRQIMAINTERMNMRQRVMTDEEISEMFHLPLGIADTDHVTVGSIRQAIMLTRYMGSIDIGFDPGRSDSPGNEYVLDSISAMEPVTASPTPEVEDEVASSLLGKAIDAELATLSEREATIVRMRFGIDDGQTKTLGQIGMVLGISNERVRQIESKAMAKLRHPSRSNNLRDFVDSYV